MCNYRCHHERLYVYVITETNRINNMIETHLLKHRQDPRYANAMIYVYIEANLSWVTANDIAKLCLQPRFYPVQVMRYDPKPTQFYGVWTGASEKQMYVELTQKSLSSGQLCYAENFITAEPQTNLIKAEIRSQLEMYRRVVTFKEGDDQPKITYTGKSPGRKDDLAIVVQMLMYWSRLLRSSKEYIDTATMNGWKT